MFFFKVVYEESDLAFGSEMNLFANEEKLLKQLEF